MAVFSNSAVGEQKVFPRTWNDAANAVGRPSVQVWSRYIEGAQSLANCDGYAEVIAKTMDLSVVEELMTCGELMVWPYSLSDPALGSEINGSCMTPSQGYGVTLSPLSGLPLGTYPCPRPADSQGYYACFSQSDSPRTARGHRQTQL